MSDLIEKIHRSPKKFVLALTGGGSKALGKLLSIVPGLEDIEVWNAAVAGCSNDAIVRRVVENTFKLLDDYKPEEIFVVVGWSSPERKDFHYEV